MTSWTSEDPQWSACEHSRPQRHLRASPVLESLFPPRMFLVRRRLRTAAQEEVVFEGCHHILMQRSQVVGCHSALQAHMLRSRVVVLSNPMYLSEVCLVLWGMFALVRCVESQQEEVLKVSDQD